MRLTLIRLGICTVALMTGMALVQGRSVLWQEYEKYLSIQEGSVVCRQGILIEGGGGAQLNYEAWLTDPTGAVVATHSKTSYSWRIDGQYSHEPVTSGTYTCFAEFGINGSSIGGLQQSRFINNCGDARGNIIKEYHDKNVDWKPTCSDFTQSLPAWSSYSFEQWNSGTYSWAILKENLISNIECVITELGSTPSFNSGYRNPVHNESIGGATNSRHVYGDAADLDTPAAPNNSLYDSLKVIAKSMCGVACVEPRSLSPGHFHADYRGSCPPGW